MPLKTAQTNAPTRRWKSCYWSGCEVIVNGIIQRGGDTRLPASVREHLVIQCLTGKLPALQQLHFLGRCYSRVQLFFNFILFPFPPVKRGKKKRLKRNSRVLWGRPSHRTEGGRASRQCSGGNRAWHLACKNRYRVSESKVSVTRLVRLARLAVRSS